MNFTERIKYKEQKDAYKIFTEDALRDIIVRKNKQIKELSEELRLLKEKYYVSEMSNM